jgi:hypothetical protein
MAPATTTEALDRHVLVMTIWLTAGLLAATLFHYGVGNGGPLFILAAFAAIIAAFTGHVVVNFVVGDGFTTRELALGLVLYATALMVFVGAALTSPDFAAKALLPTGVGFLAVFAAVVFYMVVHSGVRRAFDAFDAIRSFRARESAMQDEPRSSPG